MKESSAVPNWRRSSYCADATCVEVARVANRIAVRDSKRPDGPPLVFTRQEWHAFVAGVKAGNFDDLLPDS